MPRMGVRQHWKSLLVVAVVVLGVLVYVGQDRWRDRCGAAADELAADDLGTVLRTPDQLAADLADGQDDVLFPVGPELLDTLDALPAPFGAVVAGRVWDDWTDRPSVGEVDDDTIYLASGGGLVGSEYSGSLVVADVATGDTRWGVGVKGYGAGGGPIGEEFVTVGIPEDRAPQVSAYDLESGDRDGCTKLGDDQESGFDPILGSSTVDGGDIAVAWDAGGGDLVVRRLDPVSGDQAWETGDVDTSSANVEVDDAGDQLVVSQVATSDSVSDGSWRYGETRGITALDAEDGSIAWTWPAEAVGDDRAVTVKVADTDTDADTGRVYAIEGGVAQGDDDPSASLLAIDDTGQEVWRAPLRSIYCEATLWGDTVVTGTRLVMAHDGLLRVDVDTGAVTPMVDEETLGTFVGGIDLVGDHLVLSTESGVFVLEREDG